MSTLEGKRAIVVGASRGLGRGVAQSLSAAGASVLAIARGRLSSTRSRLPTRPSTSWRATPPTRSWPHAPSRLESPDVIAVVAGASPPLHPIQEQTWATFSENWQVDVRLTFNWLRAALRAPLHPGSRVLLMSSGAAVAGSPLSGGYAGAKATIRFMAGYADDEARRNGLGSAWSPCCPS